MVAASDEEHHGLEGGLFGDADGGHGALHIIVEGER